MGSGPGTVKDDDLQGCFLCRSLLVVISRTLFTSNHFYSFALVLVLRFHRLIEERRPESERRVLDSWT